jgi:hypothetical protein
MAFPDYAYDMYEDFEDDLGASWTETDPDTNIDVANAAAKYYGALGMAEDSRGSGSPADIAHIRYNMGAEKTDLSVGFWFRGATIAAATSIQSIFAWATATLTVNLRAYYYKASGVYTFRLRNAAGTWSAVQKTISPATWYWMTLDLNKNDVSTLRIYDTAGAEVDAANVCNVTASNNACQYLFWGAIVTGADEAFVNYFDDLVVDWTDATFPLLGWEAAGGGAVIPVMMASYKRAWRVGAQ